ncbi:MAG: peptidylprolyl isomerase [Leeuwenhoekiella sp.]
MKRKIIGAMVLLALFANVNCQDKKSSNKGTEPEATSKVKTSDSTDAERRAAENEKLKKKLGPIIQSQAELIPFLTEYGKNNPEQRVRLKTTMGNIELYLYNDTPLHRANFIMLVKQDYFNNTLMHRVAEGFVIQGGDADGYETPRKRFKIGDYLIPNEAKDKYPHVRGVLSAAKFSEQNVSAASSPFEFFIVQAGRGAHHLDGKHTVFGKVTKGLDVVDNINKVAVDQSEWPIKNIYIDMELME